MKVKYSAQVLNLYAKQTGQSLTDISEKSGISYSAINRYARGERLPDIENMLRICNALHIGVNHFFTHPDVEQTHVVIRHPEEWADIKFRYDRIEAIRLNNRLTKSELIRQINEFAGCSITTATYNHLIVGEHLNAETILGLIGSQNVELDYLFEQPTLSPTDDSVVVPRWKLDEMKSHITKLETAYRELELKNKRLEKMILPRYQERMENKDADKLIRECARKVWRAYADLQSWIDENVSNETTSPSVPYPEYEDGTKLVAESTDNEYVNHSHKA